MKRQRKRTSALSAPTKRTTPKKSNTSKEKKEKREHPILRKLFGIVLLLAFVGMIVAVGIGAGMYAAIAQEMEDMNIQNIELTYSSFVYYTDTSGNAHELEQLFDDGNRIWLDPDEIPDVMKVALVSIEDERFYTHRGVDLKRTTGAFINWMLEKLGHGRAKYGGSTITQQVVKNITHENERSATRKIKEMMRAVALERELTKDEILTLYLNLVYFANNCYGVEAASNVYFDKHAADLTLTEAATIAGITQQPSYYNPLKNPDNALKKRNVVLEKMLELGKISQEEYDAAAASDLGLHSTYTETRSRLYSYYVDQVINDVISDLQTKKGYSESFATQQVFNGGLKIYTAMDYDIQEAMESVFENTSNFPSTRKQAQAAMVIIDPYTGAVKGMIGGLGKKTESRGFNRAVHMKRQPGSSLKPLSVYIPALETGKITPASILKDEKLTIGDWSPKNSYKGYKGDLILRSALEISANTPAVRVLQEVGTDTSYRYLKDKFHLSTLDHADNALSPLALGGLTYGVTVKELAAAYSVLPNSGHYNKPFTYTKVIDNAGKLLLENEPQASKSINESTAYVATQLLSSVVNGSSGTGKLAKLGEMPVYGKTGTTNNDYDKWFVGFTPYYVGAVWYGFDNQASIRNAGVSYNVSAKAWKLVMQKVHENLSVRDFEMPSDVVEVTLCKKTGKLASKNCGYKMTEYFVSGTEPGKYCESVHGSAGKTSKATHTASPTPSENSEPETTGTDEEEIQPSASLAHTPETEAPIEIPAA